MGVLPRDGGSTEVAHIAWLKIINALVPSLVPQGLVEWAPLEKLTSF